MRRRALMGLIVTPLLIVSSQTAGSQGIGGLIKKKAVEAAKGKEDKGKTIAKDEGPITSQFEKECGPIDRDAIDRVLKGMAAERAERAAFESKRQAARPDDQVRACEDKEASGPEALKILQRGMAAGTPTEQLQAAMTKNRTDLEAHIRKTCGERLSKYESFNEYEAHKTGAKTAGMSDDCYAKLKEVALFFCKGLTREQQTAAAEQGIKAPSRFKGIYWVYTAEEAKTLLPRCSELVENIEATGTKLQ